MWKFCFCNGAYQLSEDDLSLLGDAKVPKPGQTILLLDLDVIVEITMVHSQSLEVKRVTPPNADNVNYII